MPHTARVRAAVARYLLSEPNAGLRRRIAILRQNPFPPGSRSLTADDDWHILGEEFPTVRAFVYGSNDNAVVYTYDGREQVVSIEFAIVDGVIVGRR